MRKWIKCICVSAVIMLLVACGTPQKTPEQEESPVIPDTQEQVHDDEANTYQNRLIRIGAIEYYPPYEYYIDGKMTGAGIEVIREAFTRMGYDFEIQPYPWARMIKMMQNGELDVIVNVYETQERSEFLYYSESPYVVVPYVFFKNKDSAIHYSGEVEELEGLRIGIVRDYSYGSKFNNLIKTKALDFDVAPSSDEAFERLNSKRVDLVMETIYTGMGIVEGKGYESHMEYIDYYINLNIGHLGFSKVNRLEGLKDEYDAMIYDMINEGIYHQIFKQFNVDAPIAR